MNPKSILLVISILIFHTACATTPKAYSVDPQLLSYSNLSFIRDGTTTRDEVLNKLGKPSAQYEAQRILTYRLIYFSFDKRFHPMVQRISEPDASSSHNPDVYQVWGDPSFYSLVLVFGPDGKLQKHNLVGFSSVKHEK